MQPNYWGYINFISPGNRHPCVLKIEKTAEIAVFQTKLFV